MVHFKAIIDRSSSFVFVLPMKIRKRTPETKEIFSADLMADNQSALKKV